MGELGGSWQLSKGKEPEAQTPACDMSFPFLVPDFEPISFSPLNPRAPPLYFLIFKTWKACL